MHAPPATMKVVAVTCDWNQRPADEMPTLTTAEAATYSARCCSVGGCGVS